MSCTLPHLEFICPSMRCSVTGAPPPTFPGQWVPPDKSGGLFTVDAYQLIEEVGSGPVMYTAFAAGYVDRKVVLLQGLILLHP